MHPATAAQRTWNHRAEVVSPYAGLSRAEAIRLAVERADERMTYWNRMGEIMSGRDETYARGKAR